MRALPLAARLYVLCVLGAGAALVLVAAIRLDPSTLGRYLTPLLVFGLLYCLAEAMEISVQSREITFTFTMSGTFAFALLLSTPWPIALLAIAAGSVAVDARKAVDVRLAFNAAQFLVAFGAAVLVLELAAPGLVLIADAGELSSRLLVALLPATAVMYVTNLVATGVVVTCLSGARLRDVVREDLGPVDVVTHLLLTGLAPVFVLTLHAHPLLTVFLTASVIAVYRSTKTAAERRHEAQHDTLTGIANRRMLDLRLGEVLRSARREEAPFAVLLLDLDRFKEVNDRLGHGIGDQLLVAVAERLGRVEGIDVLARLGGDEFAAILRHTSSAEEAAAVAERVAASFDAPFELTDATVSCRASIGVALWPAHGHDGHTVMASADAAAYRAKRTGSGFAVADARGRDLGPGPDDVLSSLPAALADGQVRLVYQPKVDLVTGEVAGVEALARWDHPRLGLVSAGSFVPVIEGTDLIVEFTREVLRQGVRTIAQWRRQGRDVPVAVNVSARDLEERGLADHVAALLAEHDVPAELLEIEITEESLVSDGRRAEFVLEDLRALGVVVAIDDFGTGWSSLSRLRSLPVDVLKLDRTFIAEVEEDDRLVGALVTMAHSMGLRVVAEGIETPGAVTTLRRLGCDEAQGFHFTRPLAAPDVAAWMDGHGTAVAAGTTTLELDPAATESFAALDATVEDRRTAPAGSGSTS